MASTRRPHTSFVTAVTREVVYNSILARRRKELHSQIGVAIEALHKDDLADHYEVLSEHFYRGEDYVKAANYSKRAARKAEKSASFPDAIAHAQKRVLYLEKSPQSGETWKERIDARTVLGLYLAQMNHTLHAWEAVEPVAQLARDKGYWRRLGQIQTVIGVDHGLADEDFPKAIDAYEEALEIAEREKDFITLVLASYWLGWFQGVNCDFEKARTSIQKALDINVAARNLWGTAAMRATLAYCCCYFPGEIDSLMELSSEALSVAQESGDSYSRGVAHTAYGQSCYAKREGVTDVYASSAFQTIEVTYDESKINDLEIAVKLDAAGYLGEWTIPVELGSAAQQGDGQKPFFRHTATYETIKHTVSFAQNVSYQGRPLWHCPGIGAVKMDEEVNNG